METNYKITVLGDYQIYINTEPLSSESIYYIKNNPLNSNVLNTSFKGVINKYDRTFQISSYTKGDMERRFKDSKFFNPTDVRYGIVFYFPIKKYVHRVVNLLFDREFKIIQIEAQNRVYYDFLINYEFYDIYLTTIKEYIKEQYDIKT